MCIFQNRIKRFLTRNGSWSVRTVTSGDSESIEFAVPIRMWKFSCERLATLRRLHAQHRYALSRARTHTHVTYTCTIIRFSWLLLSMPIWTLTVKPIVNSGYDNHTCAFDNDQIIAHSRRRIYLSTAIYPSTLDVLNMSYNLKEIINCNWQKL